MTQTQGAVRAAEEIIRMTIPGLETWKPKIAAIIDEETHAAEMEAFIEKVSTTPFALRHEAKALLEKVRGL